MIQLLRYAKDYRKQIILGPFFKFLEAVFELVLPLMMASLIDNGLKMNDRGKIIEMGLWMVAMSVIGLICAIICQYYASVASQGFGTELRNQLIKNQYFLSQRVESFWNRYLDHPNDKRHQSASASFSNGHSFIDQSTVFKYRVSGHGFCDRLGSRSVFLSIIAYFLNHFIFIIKNRSSLPKSARKTRSAQ